MSGNPKEPMTTSEPVVSVPEVPIYGSPDEVFSTEHDRTVGDYEGLTETPQEPVLTAKEELQLLEEKIEVLCREREEEWLSLALMSHECSALGCTLSDVLVSSFLIDESLEDLTYMFEGAIAKNFFQLLDSITFSYAHVHMHPPPEDVNLDEHLINEHKFLTNMLYVTGRLCETSVGLDLITDERRFQVVIVGLIKTASILYPTKHTTVVRLALLKPASNLLVQESELEFLQKNLSVYESLVAIVTDLRNPKNLKVPALSLLETLTSRPQSIGLAKRVERVVPVALLQELAAEMKEDESQASEELHFSKEIRRLIETLMKNLKELRES